MSPTPPSGRGGSLHCRDCPLWYGAENDGWGSCSIKNRRGDQRILTYGGHACDEGYVPPAPDAYRERAARFSGARSTSSASAVGYSSISNAGQGRRRAARRRAAGANSTRRRVGSTR